MTSRHLVMAIGFAAVAAACSSSTNPANDRTVSLSFTSGAASGAMLSRAAMMDQTFTVGGNTLVISSAEIVLRQIELKRADDSDGCAAGGEGDDDGCEEFETGPVLVSLPLDGAVSTEITIPADTGTYDEIDFEVHKVEGSADAAFVGQNPDFDGISIRVEGTFNGTPFIYTTDLDVEQEQELTTPIVVTDATTGTNVTLLVDVSTWFQTSGGALIDPASANTGGANESVVNENIKKSFKAFKDDDRDGSDSDES